MPQKFFERLCEEAARHLFSRTMTNLDSSHQEPPRNSQGGIQSSQEALKGSEMEAKRDPKQLEDTFWKG